MSRRSQRTFRLFRPTADARCLASEWLTSDDEADAGGVDGLIAHVRRARETAPGVVDARTEVVPRQLDRVPQQPQPGPAAARHRPRRPQAARHVPPTHVHLTDTHRPRHYYVCTNRPHAMQLNNSVDPLLILTALAMRVIKSDCD